MIRRATGADQHAVTQLAAQLAPDTLPEEFAARFKTVIEHPEHRLWVYERAGTVVGFVHAFVRPALEKPAEIVVQSIVTDPSARREGVGRALMREVERWATDSGRVSIALHTRNAAAFYRRLGYHEIAAPSLMRKTLG